MPGEETYREPTEAELLSTNPATPAKLGRRVRVSCPDGVVIRAEIKFEDGEALRNVLRAVIALESPVLGQAADGSPEGTATVYITRFNNEIGKVVYWSAEALVGRGALEVEVSRPLKATIVQ